jgi:type IV pilus assembly protein PilM
MGFLGLAASGEYLSVDFGASAIKIAQADFPSPQSARVSLADSEPVRDVPPDEYIEECSRVLKILLERNNISSKLNVVLALPSNSVIVRRMELPAMPEDRLPQVIRYEAESHIPFPLDQVVIDHHIIDRTEEGTELILSAIKKDKLSEFLEVIYTAGLNPEIIDIAAFSLFNLYQYLGDESGEAATEPVTGGEEGEEARPPARALVDIGHGNTDIIVARGDMLYFARSASVAGESISSEIAKKMSIEQSEAEKLKKEHGHVPLDEEAAPAETSGSDALEELAARRKARESEEAGGEAESGEEKPAEPAEEPEEEVGGLTLGAPRKPDKKEGKEEPEDAEELKPESEGLSLGKPKPPEKEKSTESEEPSGEESELSPPEPPETGKPAPKKQETPPPPAKTEEKQESGGLTLEKPKPPAKKEEEEEAAPPAPSAPAKEESDEEEEPKEGGLTLGVARKPAKDKEKKTEGEAPEKSESVEKEDKSPPPPAPPGPSKEEEEEGLSLGMARKPSKKADDEPSPPEKEDVEEEGLSLGGGGMLSGADKADEEDEEEDEPRLLGSSGKKGGTKLLGSSSKEKEDDENSGKSLGAAANNSDAESAVDEDTIKAIGSAVKPQVDRLVGELRHTFDYFQSQLDGGEISEVILAGGSSKLKNLPAYISNRLGYPVRRFNPGQKIEGCSEGILQQMLVSIGLQLRVDPEKAVLNVNLVPPDIIQKKRAQTQKQKVTVASVLGGILLVLLVSTAALLYFQRSAAIEQSEREIEKLNPIVEQVNALEETQREVSARVDTIKELERNKAKILPLLYEINRLPEDLRERTSFQSITISRGQSGKEGKLNINGVTGDFDDVARILAWLENRPYIVKHISEDFSRSTHMIGEREVNMTDFSAQYSVSFSEE